MLNARRAVRTECQSTVCWRRSMVKKIFQRNGRSVIFLTGVMTVHQVSEGQAQHIGQRLQRVDVWQPDAAFPAADGFIRNVKLLSQFGLRHVPLPAHLCKECTKFFLHPFCSHPFPQDNTEMWKTQPTERLPAGLQNKRTCSLAGTRPFYRFSIRRRSAYSWGPAETRALPCSLPSYFLKFLMKRLARSLAFSSHWEASA